MFAGIAACAPAERESAAPSESGARAPSASPHWIAFATGRSGNGDIYALDPATGETVVVAGTALGEGTVRYDPSRARFVFHRFVEERALLVSSDGDTLFEDPNGDVAPAWSPDGGWIVYADVRGEREGLYLARPDGSQERPLTDGALVDRYPAWSPDSRRIVFARRLRDGWDLHAISPFEEGAPVVRMTGRETYVGHPAWSPDGGRIAFDTYVGNQTEIAVLDLAADSVRILTDRPGNDLIPAWSPDGAWIAFGGEPEGSGNWDLWRVDAGGGPVVRLTEDPSYDGGPVFVPAAVLGR
ncbi:MAG: hypothetical protein RJQ04_18245 [Longimicrobiales bacterium]